MKEKNVSDRLTFLAKTFDVFDNIDDTDEDMVEHEEGNKEGILSLEGFIPTPIKDKSGEVLAYVSVKENDKGRKILKVSISSDVFSSIIGADPTDNKMYIQWILTVFSNLLKKSLISEAVRFIVEDLPQANTYLELFEGNKRKEKFKKLCKGSYSLMNVEDPTNINQYKSLSQLFDAVDPFIIKEPTAVERELNKFVTIGEALMPVKDRKYTLFIPKSTDANVVFDNFAGWCTAKPDNSMFKSYTTNNKKPNGENSNIYIIINNEFFEGNSDEMYQIHFESGQLKDRTNGSNIKNFSDVLDKSEGLTNFFKEELMGMAKDHKKGVENNRYLDYLVQFGFAESLFELIGSNSTVIKFMTREIPKIPNLSRFKDLEELVLCNASIKTIDDSLGELKKLEILSLTNNRLEELPKTIGSLQNLIFINIVQNPIKDIPSEIAYLDKSRGGSLHRIAVNIEDVGEENYQRLKELLPTTKFSIAK